jgi:hypothetical protein
MLPMNDKATPDLSMPFNHQLAWLVIVLYSGKKKLSIAYYFHLILLDLLVALVFSVITYPR